MPKLHISVDGQRGLKKAIRELAQRRKEMGISQLELDKIIGMADGHVAKWESFARLPTGWMLSCWVEALQCEIEIKKPD